MFTAICAAFGKEIGTSLHEVRNRGAGGGAGDHMLPQYFWNYKELMYVVRKSVLSPSPQYQVTNGAPPPPPQSQSCSAVPGSGVVIQCHYLCKTIKPAIIIYSVIACIIFTCHNISDFCWMNFDFVPFWSEKRESKWKRSTLFLRGPTHIFYWCRGGGGEGSKGCFWVWNFG